MVSNGTVRAGEIELQRGELRLALGMCLEYLHEAGNMARDQERFELSALLHDAEQNVYQVRNLLNKPERVRDD